MNMLPFIGPSGQSDSLTGSLSNSLSRRTVAALDVGSSKVACFIARLETGHGRHNGHVGGFGAMRVIGIGHQVAHGMRSGAIIDMNRVEGVIRSCVEAAERMAGRTIDSVVVNVSCGAPRSRTIRSQVDITGAVNEVDLGRIVADARERSRLPDRDVLHAIPCGFSLDGNNGVRDPVGMFGERLNADIHVVDVQPGPLRSLDSCVGRCHLKADAMAATPYASGLACLAGDESELGAVCIDLGGGTTSVSVFRSGSLVHVDVIPLGGRHITNDIARCLSTPIDQAERMKILHGTVLPGGADERGTIPAPRIGEDDADGSGTDADAASVSRAMLTDIIRSRTEEIMELVRDRLEASGAGRVAPRRAVLTGGGAMLAGVRELTARILARHTRLGSPAALPGLADSTSGPAFSTCAGLLIHAGRMLHDGTARTPFDRAKWLDPFARAGQWVKEIF